MYGWAWVRSLIGPSASSHDGSPPNSNSAQTYGPGRRMTCSPKLCASRRKRKRSRVGEVKSIFPRSASWKFQGTSAARQRAEIVFSWISCRRDAAQQSPAHMSGWR
eukprot:scaffold24286_cov30-Tisochrysis_lutea.AAC.4